MEDVKNQQLMMVGIGASAGGLAALKSFVEHLSTPTGMAFIIVQHMDPTHESLLGSLLSRHSELPVKTAVDGESVERDHIYVIPPDCYLEIEDGKIKLSQPTAPRGKPASIDLFFRSLARECADFCAAIILSGSGSDGTAGARAIKAASGLVLVQEPETAEHGAMPKSAIDAGVVDRVLPIKSMPAMLQQYAQYPSQTFIKGDNPASLNEGGMEDISAILSAHKDFNIGHYKPSTVKRRIARRMSLNHISSIPSYVSKLRVDERERGQLIEDLLINVTEFFRDPQAFQILEHLVIPDILEKVGSDECVRVWVCGCASGEEAYSVAILLLEALTESGKDNEIRVFATDFDEHAIKTARKGVYPEGALEQVPQKYLEKYFQSLSEGRYYQVSHRVRNTVSFAAHNVATDPPFGSMHLICCRNMLIYLNKDVQEKVLSSFYFALHDSAFLFLGSSETTSSKSNLFLPIDKKWRFYKKAAAREEGHSALFRRAWESDRKHSIRRLDVAGRGHKGILPERSELIRRDLLEKFLPPGIVVDREDNVVYNHGDWTAYMETSSGEPRYELTRLVIPALRSRLRSALYRVRKSNQPFSFHCKLPALEEDDIVRSVRIEISQLDRNVASEQGLVGIVFREERELSLDEQNELTSSDDLKAHQNLEIELAETRQELQDTIEELDTSTEELKASHEEALSTNEELQSANEELEASSEELRSLNEELSTLNAELKEKINQLQEANDRVNNFFTSTNVPTIFLDTDLCVQRYTPAAEVLLGMSPEDVGRKIDSLDRDLIDAGLITGCKEVLLHFHARQSEKRSVDGRYYTRHLTPYRTESRHIDGVVLVFQDVTEIKLLSDRAESREKQQAVVAKLGMLALSRIEPEDIMQQAVRQVSLTLNVPFCQILDFDAGENQFQMVSGVGWEEGSIGSITFAGGEYSQAGYTLLSSDPVIVSDLATEKRFTDTTLIKEHGIVSGVSCRINHRDPPFGVIAVYSDKPREFSRDDAIFLQSVANMLSTALHTRESQRQLSESEQRLQLAREAADLGIHDHDLITNSIRWDSTVRKIWGLPDDFEPITFEHFRNGIHPDDRELAERAINGAIAGENEGDIYLQYRVRNAKDGSLRWVEATGITTFNNEKAARIVGTVRDITDYKRTLSQLTQSEEKLRLAMGTNKIGSFEYYLTREETHWDALLHRIWGVRPDESLSQQLFWEGIHPDDRASVTSLLDAAHREDGSGRYHAVYRVINRISGAESWVEASGQVVTQNGRPEKMVGMVIDITDRMNLERSLQKAVAELKHADKQKNDFLAILGHELRNPLSALDGSADILSARVPQEKKVLEIMKHNVKSMSKLLDDLLDLNRISENRIELDQEVVDLSDIIQHSIDITESSRGKLNQRLSFEKVDGLFVSGDAVRLEQIFSNLLVNASKYTGAGGRVHIEVKQSSAERVEVSIVDNGIGIKPKILERIFDPFFQVAMNGKAPSGLGIGLALVKKLVELHGGTIKASSDGEDTGSTFVVNFPMLPLNPQEDSTDASDQVTKNVAPGLKVLLIEDNEGILETMPTLLEALGCEVRFARNGQGGIALVNEFKPQAMLVDIGLPDMSGHEVAERVRGNGYHGLMVALSGYSHQESRDISSKVGFDHHLAKPTSLQQLMEILSTV